MFVFTSYTRGLGTSVHVSYSWTECGIPTVWAGLTHEITIVRGQGREGVCAEDRSIRVLGVEIPSEYLLLRRDEYTRVYTTVYPRVYCCVHACTLPRSKYILCRARLCAYSLGIMPRIFSDGLRLPGIRNTPPKIQRQECEQDHVSPPGLLSTRRRR